MSVPPDDTTTPQFKWPLLAAIVLVAVGLFVLGKLPAQSPKAQLLVPPARDQKLAKPIQVHVIGAVKMPGLYACRSTERIQDAINRAGGPTPDANINAVNLSAFLEDGQQINVPTVVVPAPASPPPPIAFTGGFEPSHSRPLNLNTATREELETLPGIGPITAEKILAARQKNNGFKSVEELDEIPGIGVKTIETLRPLVTVN